MDLTSGAQTSAAVLGFGMGPCGFRFSEIPLQQKQCLQSTLAQKTRVEPAQVRALTMPAWTTKAVSTLTSSPWLYQTMRGCMIAKPVPKPVPIAQPTTRKPVSQQGLLQHVSVT